MPLRIHAQITNPKALTALIKRVKEGLSVHSPDYINSNILFYLEQDFSIEGDSPFTADKPLIINPNALQSGDIASKLGDPKSLTLVDVLHIFDRIYGNLADTDFQQRYVLSISSEVAAEFNRLLTELSQLYLTNKRHEVESSSVQIPDKQAVLIEIAEKLLEAIELLMTKVVEEETVEKIVRSEKIPKWLEEARKTPLRKKEHWELIKEIIHPKEEKEGFLEVAIKQYKDTPTNTFPGVRLKSVEETLSIIALREFLNDWADEIIEEDQKLPSYKQAFKSNILSNLSFFPSKKRDTTQSDLEQIQSLDIQAVSSFKKWLLVSLADFEEKPAPAGEHASATTTEDGGGESNENQEQKKPLPVTPEEKEALKKEVLEHQRFVRQEVVRLQVISTNFVLAFNRFPRPISAELASSEAYILLERQINSEIMDLINRDGAALDDQNRRAIIVRQFLFRLMANPKFQAYMALLREKSVTLQIEKIPGLDADQQKTLKEKLLADLVKNPTADFDELLGEVYSSLKVAEFGNLTDPQRQKLAQALSEQFVANPRMNVDAFLSDAFVSVQVANLTDLTAGQKVEFRQQFIAALTQNPKADVDSLLQQTYAAYQTAVGELTPGQQAAIRSDLQSSLGKNPADRIDRVLAKSLADVSISLTDPQRDALKQKLLEIVEKNPGANVDQLVQQLAGQLKPQTGRVSFNPNQLTKEHFAKILETFELTAEQQKTLFDGVDLLMLLRVSPERVSRFTPSQFEEIFGIRLSGSQQTELENLLSAYFLLRRQWFEKEYNSTSVSQAQDLAYGNSALTAEEFADLVRKKQLLKKSGLDVKHFVRASILTKSQVADFKNTGHAEAEETQQAANVLLQDRKEIYAKMARAVAEGDEEMAKIFAIEENIRFRNDQDLSEAQKLQLLSLIEASVDLSPFELESGVVADNQGQIIRTTGDAEQSHQAGKKPGLAKSVLNIAKEGVGGAVVNTLLPGAGLFVPPEVKKAVGGAVIVGGVIAGGGLIYAFTRVANLVSQFGVVGTGGILGGLAGAAVGSAGGPISMILGAIGGAAGGAGATAIASNGGLNLSNLFGGATGTSSSAALPATATSVSSLAAQAAQAAKTALTATPAGVAVTGFVGIGAVGTILVYTQLSTAFLPPITQFTQGVQNQYVTLTKTATPTSAAAPQQVEYVVTITAKENPITITTISDTFIVKSKDTSKQLSVTQSTNFDQYKTTIQAGGSVEIPYSIPFDANFQDSLLTNTFQIAFDAIENGQPTPSATSAQAVVCFGDCPKPASGCWPTSGTISQDPWGSFDHGQYGEDAFDISASVGTPIYAPFPGQVCAKWNDGSWEGTVEDSVAGYGNMLSLRSDSEAGGYTFTFGHLSAFAPGISTNNCSGGGSGVRVNTGDLIGFVGSTGFSTGSHLHYQVGPEGNSPANALLRSLIPQSDKDVSFAKSCRVTSCATPGVPAVCVN